jgi:SRSO17 transposase
VIIDDTGFAKKRTHSVGVARQYSGTLGRVDNCQVLVTAHYVDRVFDWPITAQLYLPEDWSRNAARCAVAQVPAAVGGQTKGAIALELLDVARAAGVPATTVVSDAGYGAQPTFLDGLETRRLTYIVAVPSTTHFRRAADVAADPGDVPVPYQGHGRPRKGPSLAERLPSTESAALLAAVAPQAWKTVAWRAGTKGALVKQCARVRVYRTAQRGQPHASHGWLLGERPLPGHTGDAKYYFAWNLDGRTMGDLLELMHVRWVVERFYQDAKGELGLDAYERRRWPGLHRHVALVMLAHSYLTLRQSYPGGHLKLPHLWPGQTPSPREGGTRVRGCYAVEARFATRAAASFSRQLLPSNFSRCP